MGTAKKVPAQEFLGEHLQEATLERENIHVLTQKQLEQLHQELQKSLDR